MHKTEHSPSDKIERLSDDSWAAVKRCSEVHEFAIDEVAQVQGDLERDLKIVVAGKLHLTFQSAKGEKKTGWIKSKDDVISNASFHLQIPKPLSAVAIEDNTRVLSMGRDAVYDCIMRFRDFAEYLFKDLSMQHIAALLYLQEERELPAQLRVARRLHELSIQTPTIEYTQTDLANMLGVTRLTVANALENLEREGLLQKQQGCIVIRDPDRFERWIAMRAAEVSEIYRDATNIEYLH